MKVKHPLTLRREALDLTQDQMAALLKTVQSEISKTEAGEVPVEIGKWAKAYRIGARKFRAECEAAKWVLPLWQFAVSNPREIEHIKCVSAVTVGQERERQHQQRQIEEYVEHYRQA